MQNAAAWATRTAVAGLAWGLWDVGATGVNAIVATFVFSVYLTEQVGEGLPGATTPASWLGRALAAAGLVVAVLAPLTGVWVDAPWRRRGVLALLTAAVVVLTASMSLIRDDYHYLWLGLVLLGGTAACATLRHVPYNAMLRQLSTPRRRGGSPDSVRRQGYFGSVMLLLIVYVGFISGDGDTRGLLGIPAADGQNVRAAMLLAAVWFALFALPLLVAVPAPPRDARRPAAGRRARSAPTASCGARSSANGAATATSSTTCSPARCSATG